jgi:predicted RNase H-like HicB family nuclease
VRYLVVLEEGPTSWGAFVPDLPGCVAVAASREDALRLISEAIPAHLETMRAAGGAIPAPSAVGSELVSAGG